jgi:hypothetical protein
MYRISDISHIKQRSYRVFMGLILFMFFVETLHVTVSAYGLWLAFVQYAKIPDESLAILEGTVRTTAMLVMNGVHDICVILRLGVADSIMVGPNTLAHGSPC